MAYKRSLGTTCPLEAEAAKLRLEDTLALVKQGRISIPRDADAITFLLTDGKKNHQARPEKIRTLGELFDGYLHSLPAGSKEATTLDGEAIHRKHLARILKKRCPLKSINQSLLQEYVHTRLQDTFRGEPIKPATIKKEMTTLRLMWNWGVGEGFLQTALPTRRLNYPLVDEKPPFMTWREIETMIEMQGLDEKAAKKVWECLFLTQGEIEQYLDHVEALEVAPCIYPMMAMTAHTGMVDCVMPNPKEFAFVKRFRTSLLLDETLAGTSTVCGKPSRSTWMALMVSTVHSRASVSSLLPPVGTKAASATDSTAPVISLSPPGASTTTMSYC